MGKTMKSNLMALVALLCSFGCNDTNNPNDSNGKEEKLDTVGQWLCSQTASDHTLRAIRGTGKNREVQVCANGCAAAVGCLTGASANTTKSIGNGLSSTEQGLELSGGVNIAQDCVGNCGKVHAFHDMALPEPARIRLVDAIKGIMAAQQSGLQTMITIDRK